MKKLILVACFLVFFLINFTCFAQEKAQNSQSFPYFSISIDKNQGQKIGDANVTMQIFWLVTILSIAPSILIMLTSFTRIAIVLGVLKQAIGVQQMPPNQIIVGLALFLTFFVMKPVWDQIEKQALNPFLAGKITQEKAIDEALKPLRVFMLKQTKEKELALFVEIAKIPRPKNIDDIPTFIVIPAFIVSELNTALQIAFLLYVPFVIVDIVVGVVLMSMGMMMLPPMMVSLPFKLMLFVLADGWDLMIKSLIKSFL